VFDNRVTEAFAFDNVISRNDVTAADTRALPPSLSLSLALSLQFTPGVSGFVRRGIDFFVKIRHACVNARANKAYQTRAIVQGVSVARADGLKRTFRTSQSSLSLSLSLSVTLFSIPSRENVFPRLGRQTARVCISANFRATLPERTFRSRKLAPARIGSDFPQFSSERSRDLPTNSEGAVHTSGCVSCPPRTRSPA